MFRIGEFSKLTQVTVRMLRHYDSVGLLKPAKTDPVTGYRMYSAEQISVLNKIRYLRDSGFQIAEIAAVLENSDPKFILEQLHSKCREIEKEICAQQERLAKIALAEKELFQEDADMYSQVTIKQVPGRRVLSLRRVIPDYYAESKLWEEMCDFVEKYKIEVSQDTFSIYYDEDYREADVDVELCVPVNSLGENKEGFTFRFINPVPVMASTMVAGDFSNIAGAYQAFAKWLQKNERYKMIGQNRQIVHKGPWNEKNPEEYLIEIQIPLESL